MSPSTNALTPLSRYPFSSAVAIGQCSQDRTAAHYDRREVDTNALEGRTHVSSYLCAVMSPAFTFMRLVGLYHVSAIKSLNAALVVYGLLIIAIQCIAAFRRVSLLQLNALTVQTASTLISAIFVCSGAIASMYLFRLGPRLRELHATVIQEVAQYDREMTDVRKIRAVSVFLVLFVVGISALIVASHAVLLMRFDDAAFYTQPLFTRHTLFIDFYVLFIGECACLMCAAIFIMCCHVLSRSTQVLVNHMNEECTDDQQRLIAFTFICHVTAHGLHAYEPVTVEY
ncbi:hypothetical protein Tcan_17525 [Toxocara canis]|uniref:Serpentine receptor class alpha/beta-14 n=2 Tax=Toxocara canis TaxID=6265 RepID=A0A0B2V3D1_TOXCA|nr:hypothetical protein Tcan_17525 [Toxocara canis]VDM44368.1 unnamed protein product [Toxocara canis]